MELKKSPQADLQNKRLLFFETGLSVSLLILIVAFGWGGAKAEPMVDFIPPDDPDIIQEIVAVTRYERRIPQPPQQRRIQSVSEILRIVENETEVVTEIDFEQFSDEPVSLEMTGGGKAEEKVDFGNEIYVKVEQEPQFRGRSWTSFHYWVHSQVTYPKAAIKNNIQGTVTVTFVIEKDGTVSNIEVVSSPNTLLSDEAVRVVKLSSTLWTPGKQRNTPVRSRMETPIEFSLESY